MATQTISLGPLGEAPTERRSRPRLPVAAQEYSQDPSQVGAAKLDLESPLLAGTDFLARLGSRSIEDVSLFLTERAGATNSNVDWARSVIEAIDFLVVSREDETPATEYAYQRARSLVESAYGLLKTQRSVPEVIPKPTVATDDVGGVRLSWRANSKQLRANFGARAGLRNYIYFESDHGHDVEELSAERLAGRLAWLTGR